MPKQLSTTLRVTTGFGLRKTRSAPQHLLRPQIRPAHPYILFKPGVAALAKVGTGTKHRAGRVKRAGYTGRGPELRTRRGRVGAGAVDQLAGDGHRSGRRVQIEVRCGDVGTAVGA